MTQERQKIALNHQTTCHTSLEAVTVPDRSVNSATAKQRRRLARYRRVGGRARPARVLPALLADCRRLPRLEAYAKALADRLRGMPRRHPPGSSPRGPDGGIAPPGAGLPGRKRPRRAPAQAAVRRPARGRAAETGQVAAGNGRRHRLDRAGIPSQQKAVFQVPASASTYWSPMRFPTCSTLTFASLATTI